MQLRAAVAADIDALLALERECITPPWSEGAMLGEILHDDTVFLVAAQQLNGETAPSDAPLCGFAVLRKIGDEAELFRIATSSAHRREGVAAHLLHKILTDAKTAGVRSVFLEVRASNSAAIALYERFGFVNVGHRKSYYAAPVEDASVMRLAI